MSHPHSNTSKPPSADSLPPVKISAETQAASPISGFSAEQPNLISPSPSPPADNAPALAKPGPGIRIPLSVPNLGEVEEQAVLNCLRSGWVSSISPAVTQFETQFAGWLNQHRTAAISPVSATATYSGTAALHLALQAVLQKHHPLSTDPRDWSEIEIIVPALTFIATVNPVRYLGATPVFVDLDPTTLAIDPGALGTALTAKTRAILVTHLYGFPANIEPILRFAKQHQLVVIEDAAEALGTLVNVDGQQAMAGCWGDIGCFSFNGNKTITTGGGGMVVSQNPELIQRVRHLSLQCRETNAMLSSAEIRHDGIGYNARMIGLAAATGLGQLSRLDLFLERKRYWAERYAAELDGLPGVAQVFRAKDFVEGNRPSWWLSVVRVRDRATREALIQEALLQGIEMRPFFYPLPWLAPYQSFAVNQSFPNAQQLWEQGVCLSSGTQMTDAEMDEVLSFLKAQLA